MTRRLDSGSINQVWKSVTGVGMLFVLVVALYAPATGFDFIYDDYILILDEPAPHTPADVLGVFAERHWHNLPYYRPMARATMVLQKALHGNRPGPYHLFNALAMGVTACLVYLLLSTPALRIGRRLALLGAALFGLHPIASATVYPVCSGRESLLPTLFAVGAVAAYLRPGPRWFALAVGMFAAALFSKESAVIVPGLFVLADVLELSPAPPGDAPRRWLRRYGPFAAILALYFVVRWMIFAGTGEHRLALLDHPAGPLLTLLYTVQTTLVPFVDLVYEPPVEVWTSGQRHFVLRQVAAWMLILTVGIALRRRWPEIRRRVAFWTGWILLAMVPTANVLVQEARFAERYGLAALVGVAGLAMSVATGSTKRRRWVAAVGVLVLVALAAISFNRGTAFRDSFSFHGQWVRTNPASPNAHNGLGVAMARQGRFAEAARHYAEAVRLLPDHAYALNNWGYVLEQLGDATAAVERYEAALRVDGGYAEAHYNLGNALAGLGRLEESEAHYRQALEHRPDYVRAHNNYAALLVRTGRADEALREFEAVMRLDRDHARSRLNYGILLARQGRFEEALFYYREALRLEPDSADAHFDLAVALEQLERVAEASGHYRRALELARSQGREDLAALAADRLRR